MSSEQAEQAVRSYLLWLDDPESLRDQDAIDKTTKALAEASDPIDKLRLLSALESLQAIDGDTYRNDFIAHAKEWADANGVSAEAFGRLGVRAADLHDAGFSIDRPKRSSRGSGGGKRRTRISPEAVQAAVPATGAFTIAEVERASGASTATVRKVIGEMIDAGTVVDLGPAADHTGRGRAPLTYRRR